MVKISGLIATILVILSLLVGALVVYYAFPREVTINKEVVKEVKVPVEVVKEIEIPLDIEASYLDAAVEDFLSEKLEDMTDCNGDEYDEEQIKVSKTYEDWSIIFDEDRHEDPQYIVDFSVKLKYLDSDVEEKCYNTCDVSVLYRIDKDPKVSVSC